jgi:hypothetical protein
VVAAKVVIPTLRWNEMDVHNIVLTDVTNGSVIYHDNNGPSGANSAHAEDRVLEQMA